MSKNKEIYTGLYLFSGDSETSFGSVSGRIKLPDYNKEIVLYLNNKYKSRTEKIAGVSVFELSVSELEGLYLTLDRIINDIRKLESLSRKDLLREEAYSSSE